MNSHGIGLGLTISKNIIEQFNGKIKMESEENKGSNFTFWLELFNFQDPNIDELVDSKVS